MKKHIIWVSDSQYKNFVLKPASKAKREIGEDDVKSLALFLYSGMIAYPLERIIKSISWEFWQAVKKNIGIEK